MENKSQLLDNDDSMNYTTLTSSGETTKTVYNDAFFPVEYTDNQALKRIYLWFQRQRSRSWNAKKISREKSQKFTIPPWLALRL